MSGRNRARILSTLTPTKQTLEILKEISELDIEESITRDTILEKISYYDAVLAGGGLQYDEEVFKSAGGKLKIVSRVGVGYDNIDVEAATRYGVMVTNTPGVMAESVAEHTILLMLATAKNLTLADKEAREGIWEWAKYRGTELWSKTLGQIGLGRIGYLVAKKARAAFNMQILVYDPYISEERILSVGEKSTDIESLLKQSDVVSINTPLTEETHHLIGENEFKTMKKSAVLINTGRGPIVDEEALIHALQTGDIAKAGLDVFEEEPPKGDNPLFQMDNVVLTPHQASNTDTGVESMFMAAAQNVIEALNEKRPRYLLNEEVVKM